MNKKSIILIMVCFVCNSFYIEALPALSNLKLKYDGIIKTMARRYNVPPDLIHSIIKAESNYDIRAVSKKGAVGLMQLMPETGKQYGVKDLYDPADNIEGGVKYLKDLVKLYERNTKLVLAAYNAGQEAIKKYKGIPPYPETINYIKTIQESYNKPLSRNYTKRYKYVDENGRTVLTNDYSLYKSYVKKQ
jgi:soluble lytic murein transglycosylase-like protein